MSNATPSIAVIDLGDACLAPGLIDSHTHPSLAGDGRPYAAMVSESDEMMALIHHVHPRSIFRTRRTYNCNRRFHDQKQV